MNILVVDDHPEYLKSMKESLFLNGYTVCTAVDGSEACKMLAKPDIDLIISDIKMPTLDGIMLHSFARDLEPYKKTKFIFVSCCSDAYEDLLNLDPEVDFLFNKITTRVSDLLKFVDSLMFGDVAHKPVVKARSFPLVPFSFVDIISVSPRAQSLLSPSR